MNSRPVYIGIISICIVVISVSLYYILGGFDKQEIYFFPGTTRTVVGKEYFLPDDEDTFYAKMDSAKADLLEGILKGKLTAVIYDDEWKTRDSLHCFIGSSQDSVQGVVRLPAGYDYRQFATERIYKLFVTQSQWIRPLPEENEELLTVKSIEEGEVLQPVTFELYFRDGSFSVEKWVK